MLDAAHDEQISEDELIGLVLGFSIVFTALQSRIRRTLAKRREETVKRAKKEAQSRNDLALAQLERSDPTTAEAVKAAMLDAIEHKVLHKLQDRRSMLDFLFLLVGICQRITVAISIQLLAASVRAQQPSRLVRTVSLVALASFFVFVESLTNRALV